MTSDEAKAICEEFSALTRRAVIAEHDLMHARAEAANLRALLSRIRTSLAEATTLQEPSQ